MKSNFFGTEGVRMPHAAKQIAERPSVGISERQHEGAAAAMIQAAKKRGIERPHRKKAERMHQRLMTA